MLLAINLFFIPSLYYSNLSELIPVHYSIKGIPDSYGHKSTLFLLAAIGFVIYLVLLLIGTLDGNRYNIPFKASPKERKRIVKHVQFVFRMLRFNLLVIFNGAITGIILIAMGYMKAFGSITFFIILLLIVLPVVYLFARMKKNTFKVNGV